MRVQQFKFRKNTGVATAFIAETEDEQAILDVLKDLIEDGNGILSRNSFSFEDNTMGIDMNRAKPKPKTITPPAPAVKSTKGKSDKK